ncbi:MAG: hypothetical protein NXI20_04470 [bacterium]|nr:hypothetical protein [bacterium]
MKLKITTVLCCLFPMIAFSQFTGKWDQTISSDYDVLVDVGYDNSQNVYLLGKKANTDDDIILVKYNSSGKVWARTYDSGDDDEPKRLQVDASGNSYIVGSADQGSKPECLALKYNSSGTLQWDDTYDYSSSTSGAGGIYNDAYLSGTTLYVVGDQYSGAVNNQDLVLARYTSGGSRTLRLYSSGLYEYGQKVKVDGGSVHVAAIETINDDLIYHKFSTSFGSSSNPTSTATNSTVTWTDIVSFDVSGSNAAFVADLGSSTALATYNGSFSTTTDTDIDDVTDVLIDGSSAILTGREWVTISYRMVIAGYSVSSATRSFWTDLEPKPSNDDHQAFSSGGIALFENSAGEYVVAGNMVADDDPTDGNPAINPYIGFVTFNSSGIQQEFSLYETGGSVTHTIEDSNNGDVILVGSKIFNLCDPPAPDLGTDITEDFDPSGNSILLDAGSFSSYDWSTGATTQTISVSTEGSYSVTVTNSSGCPATDEINVNINPIDQTISFNALSDKTYGDSDFSLSATASSGLTVTFTSLDTDVATVSGNTVTIVAPGEVTIRASQSGNDNYNAAPNVERTFNVEHLKYYWVGNGGVFDDYASHWATTSGGSTMHTSAPNQYCDVFFDANSFTTTGQTITGSNLSCHDLDASLATNAPVLDMDDIDIFGSFWSGASVVNQSGSTGFVSNDSEEIGIQGTVDVTGNWTFGTVTGQGQWTITESFTIDAAAFNIYFGSVVIDNGTTVTIESTPIRHMNSSWLVNNGSIVFESASNYYSVSSAVLSGTGTMTFKRNPTFNNTGQYSIFGSPITNGSTSSLGSIVYKYDESQDFGIDDGLARFIKVTSPETMTPGKGYFSAFNGEVSFTGTPNSGTIDVPLDFNTSTGDEANYDGFNLVSNPYPAGLNYKTFLDENKTSGAITGSMYLWLDGGTHNGRRSSSDYMVVNELGSVSGNTTSSSTLDNTYIASFQGFFVKATGTGQTLTFTQSMTFEFGSWDYLFFRGEDQSEDQFKTIKIKMDKGDLHSETLIGLVHDADLSPNDSYDAQKIFGNRDFNIFTNSDEMHMAIQGIPELQENSIAVPLGTEVSEPGLYTLSVDRSESWDPVDLVFLFDALNQSYTLIDDNPIQLTLTEGFNTNRFQLILSKSSPLSTNDLKLNYLISFGDQKINISGMLDSENLNLEVYNLSGKMIWAEQVRTVSNEIFSEFNLKNNQVYLMRLSDSNNVITFKATKQ